MTDEKYIRTLEKIASQANNLNGLARLIYSGAECWESVRLAREALGWPSGETPVDHALYYAPDFHTTSAWQSMESSPLDGSRILVKFDNDEIHACQWDEDGSGGAWFNGAYLIGAQANAIKWCNIPEDSNA